MFSLPSLLLIPSFFPILPCYSYSPKRVCVSGEEEDNGGGRPISAPDKFLDLLDSSADASKDAQPFLDNGVVGEDADETGASLEEDAPVAEAAAPNQAAKCHRGVQELRGDEGGDPEP